MRFNGQSGGEGAYADNPEPANNGASSNGNGADVLSRVRYEERTQARKEWKQETARLREEIRAEVASLQETRYKAMAQASEHAGSLGLLYQAEDNTFCRIVVSDPVPKLPERPPFPAFPDWNAARQETDDADADADEGLETKALPARAEAPSVPKRPEPPERPALPELPDSDKHWKLVTSLKSAVGWVTSAFVGLFVGYGLFKLTGINERRDPIQFYIAIAIGVCVIAGIKLLMDVTWSRLGRLRAQGERHTPYLVYALTASVLVLAVEAFLGGMALNIYTNKTHYLGQGGQPLWLCILLATGISTATLLFSGVVGYQKGERSLTTEDLVIRRHADERTAHTILVQEMRADHEREVAEWQAERTRLLETQDAERQWSREALEDAREAHRTRLAQHEEFVRRRLETHDEGVKNREERLRHYESLRTLPDFQELCRCISVVGAINLRLAELKAKDESVAIGRGRGWQDAF